MCPLKIKITYYLQIFQLFVNKWSLLNMNNDIIDS